jgi:hypothetical protein
MQRITVTIDRAFDISTGQMRDRQPCTLFSFQSGSTRQFGVAVPGKPAIRDGMVVSALLREADNWQTLLGWVDHGTGEIVCQSRAQSVFFLVWSIPVGAALLALSRKSPAASAIGLLMLALYVFLFTRECYLLSEARGVLEEIRVGSAGLIDIGNEMSAVKLYDVVRITGLRRSIDFQPDGNSVRAPCIGDVATVLEVYRNPPGYELECCGPDGITIWLRSFALEDVELEVME